MQNEAGTAHPSAHSPKRQADPAETAAAPKGRSAPASETATSSDEWAGFAPGRWQHTIDVRDFIQRNVTSYHGDEAFLAEPSERTKAVWAKLQPYFKEERTQGRAGRGCQDAVLAHLS